MTQRSEAARVGVADGGDVRGAVGVEEDGDSEGDFACLVFVMLGVAFVGIGVVVLVRVDLMMKRTSRRVVG